MEVASSQGNLPDKFMKINGAVQMGNRVQTVARNLLLREELDSIQSRIAKGAAGTVALKVTFTGLSVVTGVLLTRLLGTADYGVYAYVIAWVGLLAVLATMGFDKLLVRSIAAYQAQSAWDLLGGLLRRTNQLALLSSIALASLAAVAAWWLIPVSRSQLLVTFLIGLVLLPLITFMVLRQAALRGLNHVLLGQLPGMLIQPLLFIVLIGGTVLLLGGALSAPWAMSLHVLAVGVAFLAGARLLRSKLPVDVRKAFPVYQTSAWMRSALPLLLITGMYMITSRTSTLMLGAIKGTEAVGIYVIASRGAELVAFFLMSVNVALAPTIASLYSTGEINRLQIVVTKAARLILIVSIPVAIGLIVFGNWFLRIYGAEFTRGHTALAILSTAQLVNVAMGSVGLLLIMTGFERDAVAGIGVSAVINVILNAMLIPRFGLEGAAAASAVSLIIWNFLLAIFVFKRLGIHPTALGRISLRLVV